MKRTLDVFPSATVRLREAEKYKRYSKYLFAGGSLLVSVAAYLKLDTVGYGGLQLSILGFVCASRYASIRHRYLHHSKAA